MYSNGPLHMAEQKQGDQFEPTYSSTVRIRGVALRTYRKRWTIGRGGERGSGISVLMARQDDDDDDAWQKYSSLGWGCRIDGLHLYRKVRTLPNECPWYDSIWCWGSSPGALGNMEYPVIAITPMFTLTKSGSIYYSPIYGSNKML